MRKGVTVLTFDFPVGAFHRGVTLTRSPILPLTRGERHRGRRQHVRAPVPFPFPLPSSPSPSSSSSESVRSTCLPSLTAWPCAVAPPA